LHGKRGRRRDKENKHKTAAKKNKGKIQSILAYLCTESLNFSSSKNWSIKNTNSRLKEVIAAPQIWKAPKISILELRSSNTQHAKERKTRTRNQD